MSDFPLALSSTRGTALGLKMKYETYCAIVSLIHQHSRPGDRKKCMKILLSEFPGFDVQTLGSIYSQEILKKVSGMMRITNDVARSQNVDTH